MNPSDGQSRYTLGQRGKRVTDAPTEREGEGTWAKLRRRKVVQWGLAYTGGAWALIQGLSHIVATFHWPEQIQQIGTLLLLIGLPVALILAWYHGDRGQQRVTGAELAILSVLLALGGGVIWFYGQRYQPSPAAGTVSKPSAIPPSSEERPSIAVLPFENRSKLDDDAFFVDGIHDDILTQLSKVSAMKVISRTSVERFRGTKLPMKNIAEQLGVTKILEGGVQRAGERVRINVQLIDAASDAHLWAESYDRELTAANIFAIQSEIAAAIATALKTNLTPADTVRVNIVSTQSLEAWEAYQIGKQRMAKRTSEALEEAEKFFRKAIDFDPTFALAYVGLADTLTLQVQYGGASRESNSAEAEKFIAKALLLDPNLAEAWASSANIARDRDQYDRAEQMYRRAIELNPNYAAAYQWLSLLMGGLHGRNEEALGLAERAVQLDPLSAVINARLAIQLEWVSRFSDAEARYLKAIEIDPLMPLPYARTGFLYAYAMNRFADAVPLFKKAVGLDAESAVYQCFLASAYLDLHEDAEAARVIGAARSVWPDDPCLLVTSAVAHLYQGEEDKALQNARRVLTIAPYDFALRVLRNADLQAGHAKLARTRYARAHPRLLATEMPNVDGTNWSVAIDVVPVLQRTGEIDRARVLLDCSGDFIKRMERLGIGGSGIADVQIYALREEKAKALEALREAANAGWRLNWRYARDFDPNLASIRNEPEFKAVFAYIERDMARQRAELASRPKDARLELNDVSK